MDISLTSSAILVIIVGLWLVWIVPYLLRHRESPLQELGLAQVVPAVSPLPQDSRSLRTIMENTAHSTSSDRASDAPDAPAGSAAKTGVAQSAGVGRQSGGSRQSETGAASSADRNAAGNAKPGLKIRYGRLALALIGVLGLVTAVVGTVLAVIALATVWIPIVSFLTALGCLVALRAMALRDRSKRAARVERAFQDAMSRRPAQAEAGERQTVPARPAATVFDAEGGKTSEQPAKPETSPFTAEDLRRAALAVAAETGDQVKASTWEPVEIPKPTYVDAAKAERPAPQPLQLPAAPKPEGKPSIKAGATAPKVELKHPVNEAAEPGPSTAGASSPAAELAKPTTGLHNLDDVLQRRRA